MRFYLFTKYYSMSIKLKTDIVFIFILAPSHTYDIKCTYKAKCVSWSSITCQNTTPIIICSIKLNQMLLYTLSLDSNSTDETCEAICPICYPS